MHLIESASFNIGKYKTYFGVPGNLVAFACKLSFQRGGEGYVSFIAKTELIDQYIESLLWAGLTFLDFPPNSKHYKVSSN